MKRALSVFLMLVLVAVLIFSLSIPASAAPLQQSGHPGTTNLISWWSLDEASGTRNDSHSTNHLTDNNTVSSAAGIHGNAASFLNSNTEYLSIASNSSLETGDISFWVGCLVYLTNKSDTRFIMAKDNTGQREFGLLYSVSTDRFAMAVHGGGTSAIATANTVGSPSTGSWYSIQGWHSSTTDTVGIRVNGLEDTSPTGGITIAGGSSPFVIGNRSLPGFAHSMDGRIDECFYFKADPSSDNRNWMDNGGSWRTYTDVSTPPTATPTLAPSATPSITPTPTSTPAPTLTPTANVLHFATLPVSGEAYSIAYSATLGEILITGFLGIVAILLFFVLLVALRPRRKARLGGPIASDL